MYDDLFHFIENVLLIDDNKGKNVTIAIELKELLEENEQVKILLQIEEKTIKEVLFRRRKDD